MLRWRGLDAAPAGWGRCVVTIGVFDGVHRGHRQIIGRAIERARAAGEPSVVVTFDPHPSEVVRPGSHPAQLTTTRFKADLLEAIGVDVVQVLPFTHALSQHGPEQFAHDVLVSGLHASAVVVGESFRFGHRAAGDVSLLTTLGRRFGFAVEGVPLLRRAEPAGLGSTAGSTVGSTVGSTGEATAWSSTLVRTLVAAGDVESAAVALTREHRVEGLVVRGDQRGRELGYPTANLAPVPHAAVPADGVYAGRLVRTGRAGEERLPAAISIGTNPTFEGRERRVEAYVLDFSGDLYGEAVALDLTARLRPTLTFDGVGDLVEQMARDVERTRELTSA